MTTNRPKFILTPGSTRDKNILSREKIFRSKNHRKYATKQVPHLCRQFFYGPEN